MLPAVPESRLLPLNDATIQGEREFVLYWMVAARRTSHSFALQHAARLAQDLQRPLVVFEPLRVGYEWASDRLHRFVLEGMRETARALSDTAATYLAYVEPEAGKGRGLLEALVSRACAVVTDDYPCFFLPRMQAAAAGRVDVSMIAVDGNGMYPMREAERDFTTAASFRRQLQKVIAPHLERANRPVARPLAGAELPRLAKDTLRAITKKWPSAYDPTDTDDTAIDNALERLPIDHTVGAAVQPGGEAAAREALRAFLDALAEYGGSRNHPDDEATSGLSPWLHFGHIGAHEIFDALVERERWSPDKLDGKVTGSRTGWWKVGENAEAFLDQFITWRELGFNMCARRDDYAEYDSLPGWAKTTLAEHAGDTRPTVYDLEQLEAAETYDEIWNAAQRQLVREGRLHNYLRMLWAKKIFEWSRTPREALAAMIHLNNKYALDGRDPNSYSGICWTLGRYDRAWGPERPIFGKIRYMTSDSTRRKLRLTRYLKRYGR